MLNISESTKNYATPPVLRLAFRPLFVTSGIASIIFMIFWILFYQQIIQPPQSINMIYWHAHEMIFAYAPAVIIGFLLTAIKNWTGIQTLYGKSLFILWALWLAGRFLPIISIEYLQWQAIVDNLFLSVATLAMTIPIIKSKNWNNIGIIFKIALILTGNIIFYLGLLGILENGILIGLYLGFYIIISLVFMMARRLIPFFIERGMNINVHLKNSKFLDISSLIFFVFYLLIEVFFKSDLIFIITGILLTINIIRAVFWYRHEIWKYPLLWSLYVSYLFLTLGFVFKLLTYFVILPPNMDIHNFAFGIGLMTISMMARVSLGHTGRNISQPPKYLNAAFILLILSYVFRIFVPIVAIQIYPQWIFISQILWIFSFIIFVIIYTPILFKARVDRRFG